MKDTRLLVTFHVFYHDQVDYFIDKLKNISGCSWDLVVTYVAHSQKMENKIRRFKSDARFVEVENMGYDVWPFIRVIKEVDFLQYDYVLKLHTKSISRQGKDRVNSILVNGTVWRDLLVDALLKSPSRFQRCLDVFANDPKCGILCSYEFCKFIEPLLPEETFLLEEETERIGMEIKSNKFCAGTIFLARPAALAGLLEIPFTTDMWMGELKSASRGSLGHVYERILSLIVYNAGYRLVGIPSHKYTALKAFVNKTSTPVTKWVFSLGRVREGKGVDSKCPKYLTVLGRKFKIDDGKGKDI